ncbi:type III secretion system effector HECT-type E3 ubiquitin transferase [Escherichia coli]|uniref:type III secretion system effector HECT-type E3 ubiquitin transferase n=1 Tax=Escherichia coli TaxID=562 RepID=UPI000BE54814|nr:type III secretion system effector HECT-type E3 ubiquitin transferase [Escherichia coli]EEW0033275.1 E3 ubiquitin--protein ligase [Escherichia coli]EEW7564903.1 E3 ubiquitin--protein ligase [Escherichia coli]EEW8233089.1 E3 ubiquitin--protein ligase [Escherichia coli]EEX0442259.1 E3 ubiquitin--protein ligase [Escherichia coli]EFC4932196.1 type III secretion system effector HECT-type E3 ubiquitin transferase [Escherichia coli]
MLPTTNISVNSGVICFESPVDSPSNEDVKVALEKWCAEGEFSENRHEVASKILDVISTNGETLSISESITTLPDLLPGSLKELVLNGCTELKSINYLPPGLSSLSMVGCSSLEAINCNIPGSVDNLSLCHCRSLKHIEGTFPETLRNSVYLNGCNSLNESQRQFLEYDFSQGRACLSKAELTADLMWLSANRTGEEPSEQLNYSGCDLSGLSLAGLNLSSVNFSDSRFDDADLSGCDLSGASLKNTSFKNSVLEECDLSFSDLANSTISASFDSANFSGANLNSASFIGSSFKETPPDLKYAQLAGAIIVPGMELRGAILEQDNISLSVQNNSISLACCQIHIPVGSESINSVLDSSRAPDTSVMRTINSVDSKYNDEKVRSVEDLIRTLPVGIFDKFNPYPTLSLSNAFSIPPYLESSYVQEWLQNISERYYNTMTDWWSKYPPGDMRDNPAFKNMNDGAFLQAGIYFEKHPEKMLSCNDVFIQMAAYGMQYEGAKNQFMKLYDKYLQYPNVNKIAQQSDFGIGDGSGKPDWSDFNNAYNWILLSSSDDNLEMMLSLNDMYSLLSPDSSTYWKSFFLFKDGELQNTNDYTLGKLFSQSFPLFCEAYNEACSRVFLPSFLDKIISDVSLKQMFIDALESDKSEIKIVDYTQQQKIGAIWKEHLDGWSLAPEHLKTITEKTNIGSLSDTEKAEILFCLGAVFCKYSSSDIFGTEHESPEILRRYANGLLEEAYKLAPEIFNKREFYDDVRDRLQGRNNAFSCTAVLADILTSHAKGNFTDIFEQYYPLAWR